MGIKPDHAGPARGSGEGGTQSTLGSELRTQGQGAAGDSLALGGGTSHELGGSEPGARPVREDGSQGGSAPPQPSLPGPITPALATLYASVGGNSAIMARFLHDFRSLLDHRVATIRQYLFAHDSERAIVALLSLESTSTMVGAHALVDTVFRLRKAVEQGRMDDLSELIDEMTTHANALERALSECGAEPWLRAGDSSTPSA